MRESLILSQEFSEILLNYDQEFERASLVWENLGV